MIQNETADTENIIDSRMVIAAECLANPAFEGTKNDIAKEAGVSRATLYRWLRNDDFIGIVNNLVEKYSNAELGMVWKALVKQCQAGNVNAIKLYFDVREKSRQLESEKQKLELVESKEEKNPFEGLSTEELRRIVDSG